MPAANRRSSSRWTTPRCRNRLNRAAVSHVRGGRSFYGAVTTSRSKSRLLVAAVGQTQSRGAAARHTRADTKAGRVSGGSKRPEIRQQRGRRRRHGVRRRDRGRPRVARFHESRARGVGLRRLIRRPAKLESGSAPVAGRTRLARTAGQTGVRRRRRASMTQRALGRRSRASVAPPVPRIARRSDAASRHLLARFAGFRLGAVSAGGVFPNHDNAVLLVSVPMTERADDGTRPRWWRSARPAKRGRF